MIIPSGDLLTSTELGWTLICIVESFRLSLCYGSLISTFLYGTKTKDTYLIATSGQCIQTLRNSKVHLVIRGIFLKVYFLSSDNLVS